MQHRLGVIALATLVATATVVMVLASVGQGTAGAAMQHVMRIPAAAFMPSYDGQAYWNDGRSLRNQSSGLEAFVAPVILEGTTATIQSVTMHYRDSGDEFVCAWVKRSRPKTGGTHRTMAGMCSRNQADRPRNRTDTTIHPATVGSTDAVYVQVLLSPGWDYELYGVTIVYTSDT